MSTTTFSAVSQFSNGQYVEAVGQNGIAVGWIKGRARKLVAVKFTSGKKKGKILGVSPLHVVARRGRKGSGVLPRVS